MKALGMVRSILVVFILSLTAWGAGTNTVTTTGTNDVKKVKTGFKAKFTDPEDGDFDVSPLLGSAHGFLPIPIIITEPAIDYGAGVILLFLHDSIKDRAAEAKKLGPDGKPKRMAPPSMTGVMGLATLNKTWIAGVFHSGIWKNDTIRYKGILGFGSINYDYYGSKGLPLPVDNIPLNIKGGMLLQQMLFRLGDSDFLAGANYKFSATKASTDLDLNLPPQLDPDGKTKAGGVSAVVQYDKRDNIFTPDKGVNCNWEWTYYDTWLGGDGQFDLVTLDNRGWIPVAGPLVLGLRLDGEFSYGKVPFYMKPYIDLRGIPAMRFQGDNVVTAEAELRWDVTKRWSLVGFAGAGWVAKNTLSDFTNDSAIPAGGFGFRYFMAKTFGLRAGVDLGFSEEDTAIYLTVGSAWR